ncbi:hypothetical protein SmJEL517_g01097 [Synchytrium microbalum]|uniref:Magnesium chelatase n=1 Tax=Synchytrium microbalum TaxID=1806994 RepID=A0A507CC55_9FUNG|nr:uncharacterized protein SmJEL517_g01097 [Synchytrium microbalum]TPX37081.1 hypothetical protein SmJEL517_g01097 [Synchytrium microbalum]
MPKQWLSRKFEMIRLLLSGSLSSINQAQLLPLVDELVFSILICLVSNQRGLILNVPPEHVRLTRKTVEQIMIIVFGFTTSSTILDSELTDLPSALFIKTSSNHSTTESPPVTPTKDSAPPIPTTYRRRPFRSETMPVQTTTAQEAEISVVDDDDEDRAANWRAVRNASVSAPPLPPNILVHSNSSTSNVNSFTNPMPKENAESLTASRGGRVSNSNLRFFASRNSLTVGGGLLASQLSVNVAGKKLPNAVILEGLENVDATIQAALLEIIVTQQVKEKNAVHNLPDPFIIVVVVSNSKQPAIIPQLLDRIFLCHYNEGPLPKLAPHNLIIKTIISPEELAELRSQAKNVYVHPDVATYCRDIITSLRNHKLVQTGVTALASRDLSTAATTVAAILGYNIMTPAHVSIIASHVLAHRLMLAHLSLYSTDEIRHEFEHVSALDIVESSVAQVPSPQ